MKIFLRNNFVLIGGIALPLVLALVFFIAANMQMRDAEPPRSSVVYAINYQPNNELNPWHLAVNQNLLYASYAKPEKHGRTCCFNGMTPVIHVYDPVTGQDRHFDLPPFDNQKLAPTPVPGMKEIKIDTSSESPDGFTFEPDEMNDGNLITELFGGGNGPRGRKYILRKGHTHMTVPEAPAYNTELIGWVVK